MELPSLSYTISYNVTGSIDPTPTHPKHTESLYQARVALYVTFGLSITSITNELPGIIDSLSVLYFDYAMM